MMCSGNGEGLGLARQQGLWEESKTKKERRITVGLAKVSELCII
jgi:hypothetical protein